MMRKCSNCRFIAENPTHCRRLPPYAIDMGNSTFPLTTKAAWCGEHRFSLSRLLPTRKRTDAGQTPDKV